MQPFILSFFSRCDSFRDLFYAALLAETAMFIKIWRLIILYIDWMDWRAGHLTTREGTGGGAFAKKNCPQNRAFERFFQMPGVCPGGCPGEGCSRLELSGTLVSTPLSGKGFLRRSIYTITIDFHSFSQIQLNKQTNLQYIIKPFVEEMIFLYAFDFSDGLICLKNMVYIYFQKTFSFDLEFCPRNKTGANV